MGLNCIEKILGIEKSGGMVLTFSGLNSGLYYRNYLGYILLAPQRNKRKIVLMA